MKAVNIHEENLESTSDKITIVNLLYENLESASVQEDLEVKLILKWWFYVMMVICVFLIFVLLNLIVNKVNDARLEERLLRLCQKRFKSTQLEGGVMSIKNNINPAQGNINFKLYKAGISMIFNKEENKNAHPLSEMSMSGENKESAEDSLQNGLDSKARYSDNVYNNVKFTSEENIANKLSDKTIVKYLDNCRDRLSKSIESKISIKDRTASETVLQRTYNTNTKEIASNGIPKHELSITITTNNSNDMLPNLAKIKSSEDSLKKKDCYKMKSDNDSSLTKSLFSSIDIMPKRDSKCHVDKIIENTDDMNMRQKVLKINSNSTKSDFDIFTNIIYNTELNFTASKVTLNTKSAENHATTSNMRAEYENNLDVNDTEVDSIYKEIGDDNKSKIIYYNTSSEETKIISYEDENTAVMPANVIENNLRANEKLTIRFSSAEMNSNEVNYSETEHNDEIQKVNKDTPAVIDTDVTADRSE